ncbi:MAG: hypothetical protein ACSHX0_02505 [Akkermansiaceae bacterium]
MIKLRSILHDEDFLPKAVNFLFALLALLLVLVSFLKPWYVLPHLMSGADEIDTQDSRFSIYFKCSLVMLAACFLIGHVLSKEKDVSYGKMLSRYALSCLVLICWFPGWATVVDADLSGDGAWLQQQHDSMTWLGGDVYRAHAERSVDLGTGVSAQDPPERLAVFRPPTGSLGIQRLNDWVWWFGYGPSFTQFVGKGWFLAVAGYGLGTICLIGYYWRKDIVGSRLLLKSLIVYFLGVLSFVVAVSVSVIVATKYALNAAEESMAQGNYGDAREELEQAVRWMPSLINDSGVIRQMGYCDFRVGELETSESLIYQIFWFESEGYYARARKIVDTLEREGDIPRHIQRSISRNRLRIAVNYINAGKMSDALYQLNALQASEDNSIQACFHKQLIALQSNDIILNRQMSEDLLKLYGGFKSKNKRGVLAASAWMLAQGELKQGNTDAAWEARRKSKGQ